MSCDGTVMTGLDPVIHDPCTNTEGDGRIKSGHDNLSSAGVARGSSTVVQM